VTISAALGIGLSSLLLLGSGFTYSTNRGASGQGINTNAFQLPAKLDTSIKPQFRWVNTINGVINPTLNFKTNTNEDIQIQNP
jgi:hypothetical protein